MQRHVAMEAGFFMGSEEGVEGKSVSMISRCLLIIPVTGGVSGYIEL